MDRRLARAVPSWLPPAACFAAIALVFTFPLLRSFGSAFPHDAGDPSLNTWLLWWSTEHVPLTSAWWNAPMFYPMQGAMALSELLVGLLPITAPIQWATGNPLVAYNAAFVLSFPLCALAAYALSLELAGRRDVALIAGLAFAFGPYRMNELSHIQMLSYYWAPVSLWALHRYTRRDDRRWLAVFAGAWLMQALSNGYALFHLLVLIVLWLVWFVRDIRKMIPIAVTWGVASLPLVPALLGYRSVHEQLHLVRDINEIRRFSADLTGFLSAPPELALWGGRLLDSQFSTAMFPGVTVAAILAAAVVLAFRRRTPAPAAWSRLRLAAAAIAVLFAVVALSPLVAGSWSVGPFLTVSNFHKPFSLALLSGLAWLLMGPRWQRAWRERSVVVFYAAAVVMMYVLALGPEPSILGRQMLYEPPYAWLMRLPGFDVLRVPARFGMAALLCQSVVVALALARWLPRAGLRAVAPLVAIGLGVLADGWVALPVVAAAPRPSYSIPGVAAVIELPPGEPIVDFPALERGMVHKLPVVNGFSGFAPPHYLPLVYAIGHGEFGALEELAARGPLGVAIDRSLPWSSGIISAVSKLPFAKAAGADDRWSTFVVSGRSRAELPLGPKMKLVTIRANARPVDVARLTDGRVETAWGPGTPQNGTEELIVELEPLVTVYSVVLSMGPYAFGFPRALEIDISRDGADWHTVWRGETSVLTVRAALADPGQVPVRIDLGAVGDRFLRLRQVGKDATVPWWIAELALHSSP